MTKQEKINQLTALFQEEAAKVAASFGDLVQIVEAIKMVNEQDEDPGPVPEPEPNPDQEFEGGYNKTYTLRGDWGGRDFWIAGFLWKPGSEHGGLVVLLPGQIPGPDSGGARVVKVWVAGPNLGFIEDLRYSGTGNPMNGAERTHWRSNRKGDAYPDGCFVVAEGSDGNRLLWKITDTSVRNAGPVTKNGTYAGNDVVHIKTVVLWTKGAEVPDVPPIPDGESPDMAEWGKRVWIWREGSAAADFGMPNAVVVATHGKAGAGTVRLISMNGDPVTDVASMVARTKQAKAEGCIAVCIDLESHFLNSGQTNAEAVFTACSKYLPVIWAPKAFNDHLIASWGGTFADSAVWLDKFGNGQVAWTYARPTYEGWSGLVRATRLSGNDDLYVALGDFEQRTSAGELTQPFLPGEITKFARQGVAVGVFMPDSNGWSALVAKGANWQEAKEAFA